MYFDFSNRVIQEKEYRLNESETKIYKNFRTLTFNKRKTTLGQ